MNQHQFFTGEIFDAYRWFGAHIEQNAVVFRTFAPNASRITLTGACNGWTETDLVQDGRSGFWSVSVPDARAGQFYKTASTARTALSPSTAIPTALQWNCGLPAARSSPTSRSTASQTKRG
ncbi:MAG: GlgB N-terminal domain-containing protein [Butyricicoccus sp.]